MTVENALYADPRVMEIAAVSVPDKRLGELVGAAVYLKHDYQGKTTEKEIIEESRKQYVTFTRNLILIHNQIYRPLQPSGTCGTCDCISERPTTS